MWNESIIQTISHHTWCDIMYVICVGASEDDAKQFIKQMLCQPPVKYDGKTFFVQPKDQENGQYIYVNRMFDDGDNFTTEFVIYPIQQENNFWRIEIEIYC